MALSHDLTYIGIYTVLQNTAIHTFVKNINCRNKDSVIIDTMEQIKEYPVIHHGCSSHLTETRLWSVVEDNL